MVEIIAHIGSPAREDNSRQKPGRGKFKFVTRVRGRVNGKIAKTGERRGRERRGARETEMRRVSVRKKCMKHAFLSCQIDWEYRKHMHSTDGMDSSSDSAWRALSRA